MAKSPLNRPSPRRISALKAMPAVILPSKKTRPVGSQPADKPLVLRDHIAANVRVLFVGINPGLRSALLGHHFAGYSNRFWKVLFAAGLVPEPVTYQDDRRLPSWGLGMTNMVPRPTAGIHQLTRQDYEAGRAQLLHKIEHFRPPVVALLGLTLYATLFSQRRGNTLRPGLQGERLGPAAVFLLPNPSGRNAHYSFAAMVTLFQGLQPFLTERDTMRSP